MKKGKFEATPGKHRTWCDFKDICRFAQKDRRHKTKVPSCNKAGDMKRIYLPENK
jgi:hypothetical protein